MAQETDREGAFQFKALPSGQYQVQVSASNYVSALALVDARADSFLLIPVVRRGAISGRVTDLQGMPVHDAVVLPLVRTGTAGGLRPYDAEGRSAAANLDGAGRYRLYGLPPGEYAIAVLYANPRLGSGAVLYPDNHQPQFLTVTGGDEYSDINLIVGALDGGSVAGRVDSGREGDIVQLALVPREFPFLAVARVRADADGKFQFGRVASGSYDILATGLPPRAFPAADSAGERDHPQFGRVPITVFRDMADVAVPLGPGRSAVLSIRAPSSEGAGRPCSATASIELRPRESWPAFLDSVQAKPGEERNLVDLAPGPYEVNLPSGAPGGCYVGAPAAFDFSETAVSGRSVVQLAEAGLVRGQLKGPAGSPDVGFVITLTPLEPSRGEETIRVAAPDAGFAFEFPTVRPGRYLIGVRSVLKGPDERLTLKKRTEREVQVRGGTTTELDLALPASGAE